MNKYENTEKENEFNVEKLMFQSKEACKILKMVKYHLPLKFSMI